MVEGVRGCSRVVEGVRGQRVERDMSSTHVFISRLKNTRECKTIESIILVLALGEVMFSKYLEEGGSVD